MHEIDCSELPDELVSVAFEAAEETASYGCCGGGAISSDRNRIKLDSIAEECNQMLRYFGCRITSHLPHSFDCEETKELGQEWLEVMEDIDSEATKWLKELLTLPLKWEAYRGIVEVDNKLFKGITTTGYTKEKKIIEIGDFDESHG